MQMLPFQVHGLMRAWFQPVSIFSVGDLLLIVVVSAADDIRDELRHVVRDHLTEKVGYFELDFQPQA